MPAMAKKIELLAPAGDCDIGIAAINCGADAVYIGAPRFSAREAAGNTLADIEKLCAHAHRYWARVYAAVNTILTDAELADAQGLIRQLYDTGVDALIIQDTGLLEVDLPPLPLFASTQMHNATAEKVAFLEKAGFSRVILARELSLHDIRAIRAGTQVELECFVHGALCVGYSGQCFMSYAIGGRSGNRGQCAQPCRRRYRLQDAAGRTLREAAHFLCLKDLNLSGNLGALIDAGITSFKVEGRLKDMAYVVNTVSSYRRRLDALLEGKNAQKSSSGNAAPGFEPDPHKTFNRGYTRFFFSGPASGCSSMETPAFRGELLGPVSRVAPNHIEITTNKELHNGDGICFFDAQGQLQGTHINTVQGRILVPEKLAGMHTGMPVYRNYDHLFMQQLKKCSARRQISVRLCLADTPEGFVLSACDEDGITARTVLAARKQAADKPQQAAATIEKQLAKLGDTAFTCAQVSITMEQIYFLPVSTLNACRRKVIGLLAGARERARPVMRGGAMRNDAPYPEKSLSFAGNVLNQKAAAFYHHHGVEQIEPAAESGLALHGRCIMTTKYCLRHELGCCLAKEAGGDLPQDIFLVDHEGRRFELRFDCERCLMELYYAG
jgi:23S rRNA 5-hydroxycytidine C2501 synthase